MNSSVAVRPRFSGHETFACRFTWLPKAVQLIEADPTALSCDDTAIIELGLGKNMVKSLRFWLDAFGIARADRGEWHLQPFGDMVLSEKGADPFMERTETQWLLHWTLATRADTPLFVWRHVFHRRMRMDFTRSELVAELRRESAREGHELSDVTLAQHVDAMLHTYVPTHALEAPEDVLDGPLVDLKLIRSDGRRRRGSSRAESIYSLAQSGSVRVPPGVIDYAIDSFWSERRSNERVVSFRDLAHAEGSPGLTLRIGEDDLRGHIESRPHRYSFRASGDTGAVSRVSKPDLNRSLLEVYS